MRVLLVGFGKIGAQRECFYRGTKGWSVTGVIDPSGYRRQLASLAIPNVSLYSDAYDFLNHGEGVDLVDICSPPYSHHEYIGLARQIGASVICEKPVFVDMRLPNELRRHFATEQPLVYPGHNYLFSPLMRSLRSVIMSGEIGGIIYGSVDVQRPTHARGVPEWNPGWRRDFRYSRGGVLMDHGPHCVYMIQDLVGSLRSYEVSAQLLTDGARWSAGGNDVEDTAHVEVGDGKSAWSINVSWAARRRENRWRITGEAGTIDAHGSIIAVRSRRRSYSVSIPPYSHLSSHPSWHAEMFTDFMDARHHADRCRDLLESAAETTEVLLAAYASNRDGRVPCTPAKLADSEYFETRCQEIEDGDSSPQNI